MVANDDRRQLIAAARRYLAARDAAATTNRDRPLLPQVQYVVDKAKRLRAMAAAKREQDNGGNDGG